MQTGDDQQLLAQAQAGDRQAFAALVDRYWDRVFRWLCSLCGQVSLAEDLTQDAFLKAWKGLPSFQPGASFRSWLFRIAQNALIDCKRGPRGLPGQKLSPTLPGPDCDPVDATLAREGQQLLAQALTRLPEHFRAAFLLWAQDELSFAEIAHALELTEETARWRVFKARLLLVRELGSYLDRKVP